MNGRNPGNATGHSPVGTRIWWRPLSGDAERQGLEGAGHNQMTTELSMRRDVEELTFLRDELTGGGGSPATRSRTDGLDPKSRV